MNKLLISSILLLIPPSISSLSSKSFRSYIKKNLTNDYSTAFNPGYPFIFEVPEAVEWVLGNPKLNHTTTSILNPYENEPRIQIGNHHYYKIKDCGIHFLNPGEGFVLTEEMFANIYGPHRCGWAFVGTAFCTPSADCPKFRDKRSNCRSNYLQISDGGESFSLHFCNSTTKPNPQKEYTSAGGLLEINYRFSQKYKKPEFECRVKCLPIEVEFSTTLTKENKTEVKIAPLKKQLVEEIPPPKFNKQCKCGKSQKPLERQKVKQKVKRKPTYIFSRRSPRILGGRVTYPHQYPWMVGILNPGKNLPFCGGSLINDRYVLTAAHCVEDEEVHDLIVILKEHDFNNDTETSRLPLRRRVSEIIPYPFYLESTFFGDVALLHLDRPVDIRDVTTTPICLPNDPEQNYNGQDVIAAGWGTEIEGGPKSPLLQEVLLKIFSNEACNDYHYSNPPEPLQVQENMICAGYPEGQRDTCSGDSGGPIFHNSSSRFTQVGVTSWGFGCGLKSNPGVFSRVTSFLYWIRMHTVDSIWCL